VNHSLDASLRIIDSSQTKATRQKLNITSYFVDKEHTGYQVRGNEIDNLHESSTYEEIYRRRNIVLWQYLMHLTFSFSKIK